MRFIRTVFSLNFLYVIMIAAQLAAIIFLCLYVPAVIPLAAAYAGAFLLSFLTAAVLLAKNGGAEGKCAWFVLIASLPIAGAAIYLIVNLKNRRHGLLKVQAKDCYGLGACANFMCGTCEAGYDDAVYFKDGSSFFDRLFFEMKKAENLICIEFFIVCGGQIFEKFIEALQCANHNGAKILMLADGFGSGFKLRKRDIKRLRAAGAEVKILNRLTPLPRSRLNLRDHRKIVTVDGKTAFTGGVNLADEYANISSPYGYWKDTGVAVLGTAAKVFEGMFLAMWRDGYSFTLDGGGKYSCLPYCDNPPEAGFCEELYAQAISSARERVHIMTPYFCIGERLAGALKFAAGRGVDVAVLLPHVPDKPYAFELSKTTAHELECFGVKFFEFTPGFMHAKAMVCDSRVFLGSYNFDFRSMRLNYECGIMLDGPICEEVERDFEECRELSQPLTEGKISPAKRVSRFILKLFAPLI